VLGAAGLPSRVPERFDAAAILAATRSDKKARAGHVEYAVASRVGVMAGAGTGYALPLADDVVRAAIEASR